MTFPTVTIGVTTYNAEETVREALQSALDQSVPIEQILVIDDCSTDRTMEILAEYAQIPAIEVHQNPENSGVAVSRNEIVRRARGEFIVFFDDDDVSDPRRVELQVQRILDYEREFAGGAPVVCHTARRQSYPDGTSRVEPTMGQRLGRSAPSGQAVARRALMGEPLEDAYGSLATCSQAARSVAYRAVGGFDASFKRCQDTEIAIRFAINGAHFVGLAEPLVIQRMTPTSDKNIDRLKQYFLMVLDKHQDIFTTESVFRFSRQWASMKFDWLAGRYRRFVLDFIKLGLRHPFLTFRRIRMALPNLSGNRAFGRFTRIAD